jgi:hypothetical protein
MSPIPKKGLECFVRKNTTEKSLDDSNEKTVEIMEAKQPDLEK